MLSENKCKLLAKLAESYPDPASELNFSSPYQLLVAVMLSAQCTDKKVNETTPKLFEHYPDFAELGRAKLSGLQRIIRPINYYRTKSRNLIATGWLITSEFGGEVPRSRVDLMRCPGIGQKSANVILGELGHEETFPVDTHVFRVARRLKLAKGKNPHEVEEELKKQFDGRDWRSLHHWLILHGRRVCKARKPLCGSCVLCEICPSCGKIK